MNDRFLSMLGMARRAGKACFGYDKALGNIHANKAKAVFCASDLSPKTKKGLDYAAENTNIKIVTVSRTMFEMTSAVGLKTGIVCITDSGFANKLISLAEQSQTEQDVPTKA